MTKKRIIILGSIILLIVFLSIVATIIYHKERYQSLYIYETTDEVIALFENNISDFDDYVSKFHDHDMWVSYFEETLDADFVNYKGFKKYTTEEEFEFLVSFYEKYHPTFWGRKSLGFYVSKGHVKVIKDKELSESTQLLIERAEKSGAKIKYYENEWILIEYPPSTYTTSTADN